jgi:methylglutamate dehydrogenase subunit D
VLDPSERASTWVAQSAWDAIAPALGRLGNPQGDAGVRLALRGHVDMATVIVRRAARLEFDRFVAARWGFTTPATGRAQFGPNGGLVWSAPDQWLAVAHAPGSLDDLETSLAGVAAVSDQGDGRALIDISGPEARRALAKGLAIDLHPDVFTPGCAAVTAFAHMSVQVWQAPDAAEITLCVARTTAGSVLNLLRASAAEYGLVIER